MKKLYRTVLLAALTVSLVPAAPAKADTLLGGSDWSVQFTADKKMVSNFKTQDLDDVITGLQPGDDAKISLKLQNNNEQSTDWYMTNKVLYSLEDRSANSATAGGAYTYILTYTNPEGEVTTLFNSDTVGGDDITPGREGLREASSALEDYFFLDDLSTGEAGRIDLTVALDGETQGNDYQDTLADLQMNFAVELNRETPTTTVPETTAPPDETTPSRTPTPTTTPPRRPPEVVRTGDDTNLTPYYILGGISGALLLCLGFWSLFARKKENDPGKEGAEKKGRSDS